jgi:uncharacterized protein YndB with AHSA1/START domain
LFVPLVSRLAVDKGEKSMSVSISAVIEASINEVWDLVSDFAGLRRWHPALERCETKGSGEGAVRTVYFADWWAAERLARLDPVNHIVTYVVTDSSRPPVIGVQGTIQLTNEADRLTQIDWTSGLNPENPHAATVNAGLEAYYPVRIGHLKQALGLTH